VHAAVLEATVDVLYESGYEALSVREVAERADVHESSIYRRWGQGTTSSSMRCSAGWPGRPDPGHGLTARDLLATLRAVAAFLGTPLGENLVLMALRNDLPILDAARDKFWNDRFTRASAILDRAEARGELRSGVDRFLTLETLVGPLYLRFLLTREPLSESVLETVVDLVLTGIAVEPSASPELQNLAPDKDKGATNEPPPP